MTTSVAPDIDFSRHMRDVALLLLGDPNPELSSKTELRFGKRGSLSVDLEKGTYFDNEQGVGGGVLDLIGRETGARRQGGDAARWFRENVLGEAGRVPAKARPREVVKAPQGGLGREVASYRYTDEAGAHLLDVVRFEPKDFRQRAPDGSWKVKGIRKVLYHLPRILAASEGAFVYVVEGEKDVHRLEAEGLIATTNPGGAGKWLDDYSTSLAGRTVVIVPDNDQAGRDHADKVSASLRAADVHHAVLWLDGLPEKGDVADWLDAGHTVDELDALAVRTVEAAGEDTGEDLFPPASRWAGKAPPPREWIVQDMVPAADITMLSGDGGTGKSLIALQLAVSVASGSAWLGRPVLRTGPALYLSAEDDEHELHRRSTAICAAYGLDLEVLPDFRPVSMVGRGALLAGLDRKTNALFPTDLFTRIEREVERHRPALLGLDTLADLHTGDEINRAHARQFIGLLRGLSVRHGCAIVLLAHPSLTGMSTGTGLSGSTGWNGSVRSRLYFERVKDEGHEPDPDLRRLTNKKNNYGPLGIEFAVRWDEGVFVAEDVADGGTTVLDRMAANAKAERVFLKLLDEFAGQERFVSHSRGTTYAPTEFVKTGRAEGLTKRQLEIAMDRLFHAKAIRVVTHGPPSKRRSHIERASE